MSEKKQSFQGNITQELDLTDMPIPEMIACMGQNAQQAVRDLGQISAETRAQVLRTLANSLKAQKHEILAENEKDQAVGQAKGLSAAMIDRLILTSDRVDAIADACLAIADLPDPLHKTLSEWQQPSGLKIKRVSVPLGVIGMIYESRPNVTIDAAALCFKAGNAVILRSGSESFHSSLKLAEICRQALITHQLNPNAIQIVPTKDREAVGCLLRQDQTIDVIIPRGGPSLVARVSEESRVTVLKHLDGINHVYIHQSADLEIARKVCLNAKMRRVSICGAAETLLIDRAIAADFLPEMISVLQENGCEIRGDQAVQDIARQHHLNIEAADQQDWQTEYLEAIISIKVIDDLDAACQHIQTYGSQHTEAIIATDKVAIETFCQKVDTAIIMVNTSTQFADGGEFGMGAEIGISTGKIHARGPVGVAQLTSIKYIVASDGAIRP